MNQPFKKESIKTAIVTSNAEFKAKTVSMMNNVAFIAEKTQYTDYAILTALMLRDPKVRNIVVDCTCKEGRDFLGNPELAGVIAKTGAIIMAYFETASDLLLSLDGVKAITTLHHHALPQQKEHYVVAFHHRKPMAPPAAPASTAKAGNVFIEATNHVKESFDALTLCLKDRKNLKALEQIGQRFNGVFGTYSFFGDREGFRELSQLSTVIDDLCRTYQTNSAFTEITGPHADLLLSAAKCSFLMLKELREDRPLTAAHKTELARITALHAGDSSIGKRASQKQTDVDSMIDQLLNKAS